MADLVSLIDPDKGYTSEMLGGKGYNLWRMAQAGLPVPSACIIPTSVCREYMADPIVVKERIASILVPQIMAGLSSEFGYMPLVSVRSGAKVSMPGMMDTILNVGITFDNLPQWVDRLGLKCMLDCSGRLQDMYREVVGTDAPPTVEEQLLGAIIAVLESWDNERAVLYRQMNNIPHDLGTAVIVQTMVFGNFNDNSCTGVCFSRDPSTGECAVVGEYLTNAQGEDVVDGSHTPHPLSDMAIIDLPLLQRLKHIVRRLEAMNKDVQEVEFTVQDGKIYILQTRAAKRAAAAAVKIAVDMVADGLITKEVALSMVTAEELRQASRPVIDSAWLKTNPAYVTGLPASPGVAVGKVVFTAEAAVKATEPVILVTQETNPDDLAGMAAAVGILTARGGKTSHAAVVARGMNKPAVVGCNGLLHKSGMGWVLAGSPLGSTLLSEGTQIAIDGSSGSVWVGVTPAMVGGATGPVRAFLRLLSEVHVYYEVATKAEQIINPTRVVVPAYLLGVAEFEAEIEKMAAMVDDLIIDLREVLPDPMSHPLVTLCGQPESDLVHKLVALEGLKLGENVRVICAKDQLLLGSKYSLLPIITKATDLDVVNGLVVADHHALALSKEQVAISLAKAASEGRDIVSLNCTPMIDRQALKKGVKFAAIPLLAAQSLLG